VRDILSLGTHAGRLRGNTDGEAADRAKVAALHRQMNAMMAAAVMAAVGLMGVLVAKL
jgi:hypothetical protein